MKAPAAPRPWLHDRELEDAALAYLREKARGRQMTPEDFRATLERLGLTQVGAARLLGAGERSARRWAETGAPNAVAILLRLLEAGKITAADIEALR